MNPQLVIEYDKGSGGNKPWFEPILNIYKKLIDTSKHVDDDWDIPFERIRMRRFDYQERGSQGDVFYGKLSNTPVAVKRVKDYSLTQIKHLRDLNHKNIIKFRGISQDSSYYYIIMEWCPYGTLHAHLHSGRQLAPTILSNFALQIANGMKYLHSKNIIHRDLKPSNILLTHHDVLKISDFGTHKIFTNDKLPVTSITYAGTHAYMAPEVIRSEPYSFPVDVWSYGVVLWEIMTGVEPYKNLERSAVVWAVGNDSFRLPIPLSLPTGFNRTLVGCWKASPEERFTFQQICIILKGATHEIDRISKEQWSPLQAEWKRYVREELDRHLLFKKDPTEDVSCRQKRQALDELIEQAQKRLHKNNEIYLKLQECCMHIQRERDEVSKQMKTIKDKEIQQQNLIDQLNRIKEELKTRGIELDCL